VDELIGVPVVGAPVVYAAGFVVLILLALTGSWAGSLVTVAHEGGHMLLSVLTLRSFRGFTLRDGGGGATSITDDSWGVGDLVQTVAGYLTPPLLGLGGAAVLVRGNAWGVLAAVAFLLAVSFFYAENALAFLVTLVALTTVVLVLWLGALQLQVALAAGAVWLMLLGGVRAAWIMDPGDGSDAYWMARGTLIPRGVWKLFWITVALACLYAGGRLLFVGTAWPAGVWPFDVRA
jgi:hypothetical protein